MADDQASINPYADPKTKIFTVPSSRPVRLYGPEIDIVDTPQFQRLSGIKQLGTAYLIFRGAVHTRFEHSLGTLERAEQIIEAVNENPKAPARISSAPRRLARLLGLLHDITHIPFSHTLEDEFGLFIRHDINPHRLKRLVQDSSIGAILSQALGQGEYAEFLRIMQARTDDEIAQLRYPYVADIVGNTVCADSLDYITRDLQGCGMPGALGDRFLNHFTITPETALLRVDRERMALNLDKRGMPRPDVESEVVKLLSYRYELAERVYFHHAKNAASVMIGRAVQAVGLVEGGESQDNQDIDFDWLSDDLLLHVLANADIAGPLGLSLSKRTRKERQLATALGKALLDRRLHKIAYLGVLDDLEERARGIYMSFGSPAKRRALEDRIARRCGLDAGHVLLHLPNPKMLEKLATVRILTSAQNVITLEDWDARHSRRMQALNSAHRRLWRVAVYVHPDTSTAARKLVRAEATDLFGAASRYVEVPPVSAYIQEIFELNAKNEGWDIADRQALDTVSAREVAEDPRTALDQVRRRIEHFRASRIPGSAEDIAGSLMHQTDEVVTEE